MFGPLHHFIRHLHPELLLTRHSMSLAITRSLMRWTPINELQSWTPATLTSRPVCSSFAQVVPTAGHLPLLLSLPTFIFKPTKLLALLALNGVVLLSSLLPMARHLRLRELATTGPVDCLTSTLLPSLPTRMRTVSPSEARRHRDSASQALSMSSCVNPTRTRKGAVPLDAAHPLRQRLTSSPSIKRLHHRLRRSRSPLLHRTAGLSTLTGEVQLPQRLHLRLLRPTRMAVTPRPMASLPSGRPIALDLMVDLSTITECHHPSQHIPNTKLHLCTTIIRICLLQVTAHHPLLRLPCLKLRLSVPTTAPHRSAPSACAIGRRSRLPRSRRMKRTVLASTICDTVGHLLRRVITTVATRLRPDELKISDVPRSLLDAQRNPAMQMTATTHPRLPTTLKTTLLDPVTSHLCSKGLALLGMTSLKPL